MTTDDNETTKTISKRSAKSFSGEATSISCRKANQLDEVMVSLRSEMMGCIAPEIVSLEIFI